MSVFMLADRLAEAQRRYPSLWDRLPHWAQDVWGRLTFALAVAFVTTWVVDRLGGLTR